jgi:hypothetical protein
LSQQYQSKNKESLPRHDNIYVPVTNLTSIYLSA